MKQHHPIALLVASFALAFALAITWVVMMTLTLPPTDGAYGQTPFADPLVFPIMSIFASMAAILAYPWLYLALRDRPLPKSLASLAGVVLAEIVLVTPLNAAWGFVGSFVAFAFGLGCARRLSAAQAGTTVALPV